MRIVDRSSGIVVLEVPEDLGSQLTDLVEDVQSFQVSELFLEVAARESLDNSILEKLGELLSASPTLFLGSEPSVEGEPALRLTGQLLDHSGAPISGLVVTAQSQDDEATAWAFSRPDGTFCLDFASRPDWSKMDLLVSGRGGLLLSSYELDELHDGDERMEPFHLFTVAGRVRLENGEPLRGGRVEAWSTWAVTGPDGEFRLPVDRLGEELQLEVFAPSGQPLGGYWTVKLPDQEPIDIGESTVPVPTDNWPDSEEPLIADFLPEGDSLFPGVSDHPLS